jgi:hypothetical protein
LTERVLGAIISYVQLFPGHHTSTGSNLAGCAEPKAFSHPRMSPEEGAERPAARTPRYVGRILPAVGAPWHSSGFGRIGRLAARRMTARSGAPGFATIRYLLVEGWGDARDSDPRPDCPAALVAGIKFSRLESEADCEWGKSWALRYSTGPSRMSSKSIAKTSIRSNGFNTLYQMNAATPGSGPMANRIRIWFYRRQRAGTIGQRLQ